MLTGGLIGAGAAARFHAEGVASQSGGGVCFKWVWDADSEAAQALGQRFGIAVADSLERILDDEDVDFVDICTPSSSHREYVERAAEAAKHIFCEKPLALTMRDAEAMVEVCKNVGVCLGVGMVTRYLPQYRLIHQLIRSGNIGEVAVVHASRCARQPAGAGNWYHRPQLSGGVVVDLLIDDIDFCQWCFGRIEKVFCIGAMGREDIGDYALLLCGFGSGMIAHLEGSWAEGDGFYTRFEAAGDSGLLEYDSRRSRPVVVQKRGREVESADAGIAESSTVVNPFYAELSDFAALVEMGRPMQVSVEDALSALRVALTAKRSYTERAPLVLR